MIRKFKRKSFLGCKSKVKFLVCDVMEERLIVGFDVCGKNQDRIEGLIYPDNDYSYKCIPVGMLALRSKTHSVRVKVWLI